MFLLLTNALPRNIAQLLYIQLLSPQTAIAAFLKRKRVKDNRLL